MRGYWKAYYGKAQAIAFVIDSSDRRRLAETSRVLQEVLDDDTLIGLPLLVLANKQDLPGSMRPDRVAELMGMHSLRHKWYLQPCSAVTGDGLYEGLEWLNTAIRSKGRASAAA